MRVCDCVYVNVCVYVTVCVTLVTHTGSSLSYQDELGYVTLANTNFTNFTNPTISNTQDSANVIAEVIYSLPFIVIVVGVILFYWCVRVRRRRNDLPCEETGNRFERDIDTQQNETEMMLDYSRKNEREDNSKKLDGQLRDYSNRLKGLYTDIRIFLFLSHISARVSETKIEEASVLLGEKIVIENDFKMWETNKSRSMYFFRNWVDIDKEHCVDEVKGTLIEVLQAVIKSGTKFVIILPLSIWDKDPIIHQLRDLPYCKTWF
ncbi:uncharacterized protein LOC125683395 [Ostrea edulis]|uniref:uncharacterized protein LOC125683395 n=1 Tax=Ostrea edulis TaxID=37623 RepID=UPI0024AFC705|nr:uncharacterized protein LOC125683395 [Ostrea edulis]